MSTLTFACPTTGHDIDPGIETDPQTLGMVRELSIQIRCPHCNGDHEFHIDEGRLANAA